MRRNELRFVSLVGDVGRHSPVQAIANTLDELAPDDVAIDVPDEPRRLPPFHPLKSDVPLPVRSLVTRADAVAIVTPDMTGSIPNNLQNALDWLGSCRSRPLPLGLRRW